MKNKETMFFRKTTIIVTICLACAFSMQAKENVNSSKNAPNNSGQNNAARYNNLAADCDNPTASYDIAVNNVRARIHNGGDMWWDLVNNAQYEVPKGGGVHSMFASAVWIGGVDAGGQLKVAAQTYRQSGVDFWPGPLDNNASITEDECKAWDQMFVLDGDEWVDFINDASDGSVDEQIPQSVLEWPAKGNPNITLDDKYNSRPYSLAPFYDSDQNGIYEPAQGDYPILADRSGWENARPDQMVWWVYNDKGNIHTETSAQPIGIEIQATAFAFKTNNELNDMTFYTYQLINRGNTTLDSTFIAQWVDPDLGAYDDDFVGCDTAADLGICYNGDKNDGPTSPNYGSEVPIVAVDFFEGPEDTAGNRLGMSTFLYYDNDFSVTGNPTSASHYYGYMTGSWKDGTPFTCGGNGYGGSERCDYMFPSPPDEPGWSECSEGNQPFDRRFLQSSGPFVLQPGAVNNVTIGVVWVPDQSYPCPTFDQIKLADKKAQALFENGFQLIEGPDAPDLNIREMNQKLIISLTNDSVSSNNFAETYDKVDPAVKADVEQLIDKGYPGITKEDSSYKFQGYKVYQVRDAQVSVNDLDDPDKARLIAQFDRRDSLTKLVNWKEDPTIGELVPTLEVNGNNEGIEHSIKVSSDQFAEGDAQLVNHQTYYFTAVAYAANQFRKFSPNDTLPGQEVEYLEGIKNVKIYSAKPHMTQGQNGGMRLNAKYGDAPKITRIEGQGNGNHILEFTDETIEDILTNGWAAQPTYESGNGPVKVMIYDPTKVPDASFELSISDSMNLAQPGYKIDKSGTWQLKNLNTGKVVYAHRNIDEAYEQVIQKWGLIVEVHQVPEVSKNPIDKGFIEASIEYEDGLNEWLGGISDEEGQSRLDWIRSGTDTADYKGVDNGQTYEEVLDGTWAPYRLCNSDSILVGGDGSETEIMAPALSSGLDSTSLDDLASVDIVLTSDKSKWTRCVVVESHPETVKSENGARMHGLRLHPSMNQDGSYTTADTGRSWFPGYAVNLETGERLNIMFAEDSWLKSANGGDMAWNPTSTTITPQFERHYGGKHFIYVMQSKYDGGESIHNKLEYAANFNNPPSARLDSMKEVYQQAMWVGFPLLESSAELLSVKEGIIPNRTTIRLRVAKPYRKYAVGNKNDNNPLYSFSTSGFAVDTGVTDIAKNALDSIRIVPNPYYGYSGYESGQLDNEVKITNLPPNASISIYTIKGTLVREFNRSVSENTSTATDGIDNTLSWDLTNLKGVPIASGVYLIHVEAPGLGERVLKWFGVMRPTDLSTF